MGSIDDTALPSGAFSRVPKWIQRQIRSLIASSLSDAIETAPPPNRHMCATLSWEGERRMLLANHERDAVRLGDIVGRVDALEDVHFERLSNLIAREVFEDRERCELVGAGDPI